MRPFVASILLIAGLAGPAGAQTANDGNVNAWLMYFGDHPIGGSRFSLHVEGQARRADAGLSWQQLLLRTAGNVQITPALLVTGGYGFVRTHRYGDHPVRAQFDEHRTYEQVQYTKRLGGLDWQNRLRLEQRHILGTSARYENRVRYMLRTNLPVPGLDRRYYLGVSNEVFFNFGRQVAENTFDQNRAYIALGRQLPHQSRVEVGFMEQTVQQRSGLVFEHNHTLQVALYSRAPFGTRNRS